jgi:hypothetical protein
VSNVREREKKPHDKKQNRSSVRSKEKSKKRKRKRKAEQYLIGKEGEFLENGVEPGQRGLKRRQ